jgi:sugar phosphate isomerase/epimerase
MRLGFSPTTAMMLDLDASFALADELGLAFVELSADVFEIAPFLQQVDHVRDLTRSTGIGTTVHLSYVDLNLAALSPLARAASVERSRHGLEYAHAVGASCGVLHTGFQYLQHPQVDPLVEEALRSSLAALEGSEVPIALENLVLGPRDYLRGVQALRQVTQRHGMKNCFDVGHAHVEGCREGTNAIQAYIDTLGDDVIHLHLHDNFGKRDDHLPTGAGTIDYGALRGYLMAFEGTVCLEIAGGPDEVRSSVAHLRGLLGGDA